MSTKEARTFVEKKQREISNIEYEISKLQKQIEEIRTTINIHNTLRVEHHARKFFLGYCDEKIAYIGKEFKSRSHEITRHLYNIGVPEFHKIMQEQFNGHPLDIPEQYWDRASYDIYWDTREEAERALEWVEAQLLLAKLQRGVR